MCVDSDDTVPHDMIETVLAKWATVRDDSSIAGMIGMCGKDESTPLKTAIPNTLATTTMYDLYNKHHHKGDTAHIHRTAILKSLLGGPMYFFRSINAIRLQLFPKCSSLGST